MNQRSPSEGFLPSSVGRYLLHQPIARGGMATVHAARLVAAEGVTRLVAAKRLHPHFLDDPELVEMFRDEARIASRIHHPNVVPVLDVILEGEEAILVQEYVHGVPLSHLFKLALAAKEPIPLSIALTIVGGILSGLHAAHEATDDVGEPLGIVHRDVSPQNVLVSVDGVPRLVDFGIAKAKTSLHHTREGLLKGKLAYMAPEQLRGEPVTRTVDVYAAGVVLWELIVNRGFYDGKADVTFVRAVALGTTPTPTQALEAERDAIAVDRWAQVYLLEPIITRAMSPSPTLRYPTAAEMAAELAEIAPNASAVEVAAWVRSAGAEYLEKRQKILLASEESYRTGRISDLPRPYDEPRTSGTRMRLGSVTVDAGAGSERRTSLSPASATAARFVPFSFESSAVPWIMVGGLLLVVGLLAGIVTMREPSPPAAAASNERPTVVAQAPPPVHAVAPVATVVAVPAVSVTIEDEEPAPVKAAVQQPQPAKEPIASSRPVPPPPPVVRFVPPIRVAPAPPPRPAPTPSAAPTSSAPPRDCNPPFYFDGTKKVFKPSCI